MARKTVVYDDFSKGDIGRRTPSPNLTGYFKGTDVWVYPNGSIGPRPPFRSYFISSGLPTKNVTHMVYNEANNKIVIITSDLGVYSFTPRLTYVPGVSYTAPTMTNIGTLAAAVTSVVSSGDLIYCVRAASITTGGVSINVATNTINAVAGVTNGNLIGVYGSQFVIVDTAGSNKNRLHYSATGDFTSWPGNFVDIGTTTPISGLFVQRNSLSLAKPDGTWWNVTGVLGAETVRRIERGLEFVSPGVLSNGDNVWWVNKRDALSFTGAQIAGEMRPPQYDGAGPDIEVAIEDIAALEGSDDLMAVMSSASAVYAHIRHNGIWTKHTLPITPLNAAGSNCFIEQATSGVTIVADRGRTGGAGDTSPTFYAFFPRAESPYEWGVTDTGNTAASFYTNEYWPEDGSRVTIKRVIVDLSFDQNLAVNLTDVGFTLTAQALNRYGLDDAESSDTRTWNPPAKASAYTSPTTVTLLRQRAIFQFGDQGEGGGAVLKFTAMKGCVIHRIVMEVDEVPEIGR